MRISCPPTISPCYYGVDTPTRGQLIACNQDSGRNPRVSSALTRWRICRWKDCAWRAASVRENPPRSALPATPASTRLTGWKFTTSSRPRRNVRLFSPRLEHRMQQLQRVAVFSRQSKLRKAQPNGWAFSFLPSGVLSIRRREQRSRSERFAGLVFFPGTIIRLRVWPRADGSGGTAVMLRTIAPGRNRTCGICA